MTGWLEDLVQGLRSTRRHRGLVLVVGITLAVGLGATGAMWSAVDALVLRPVPVPNPETVLVVDRLTIDGPLPIPIPTFFDWKERNTVFQHLGAAVLARIDLIHGERPTSVAAAWVGAGFFDALGRPPRLGRAFGTDADVPGGPPEAVLGHALWQRHFGGDSEVLGRVVRFDRHSFTIVGVMPPDFAFPTGHIEAWVTLGTFADQVPWNNRSASVIDVAVGRLKQGRTLDQAKLDLDAVTETIVADTGLTNQPEPRPRTLAEGLTGPIRQPLRVLLGSVGFVLLLVCANIANLLLARGEGRIGELATRSALGADRARLIRQLLGESLALALVGATFAIPIALGGIRLIRRFLPPETPFVERIGLDLRALLVMVALAVVTALLFGLLPAFHFSGADLRSRLHPANRTTRRRGLLRDALVVAELALAVLLLIGAGLMIRSLRGLQEADLGFRSSGLLTKRITLPYERYPNLEAWTGFHRVLADRAVGLPEVERVAWSSSVPLDGLTGIALAAPEGRPLVREEMSRIYNRVVSPEFFETMGIPLQKGRAFTAADRSEGSVVIVDERLAEMFWPGQDPLGQNLAFEFRFPEGGYRRGAEVTPTWREVVGVVAPIQQDGPRAELVPDLFIPFTQVAERPQAQTWPGMTLVARFRGQADPVDRALAGLLADLDGSQPSETAKTIGHLLADETARERLLGVVLTIFSAIALGLALLGVYGVIAHGVRQRRREIAVRTALGADRRRVVGQVIARGLVLASCGAALGLVAAYALGRFLESLLFEVEAVDPGTYAGVTALALLAAVAAAVLPARAAAKIDPMSVLREE